ncbi:hypothetical protein SAMN03159422_04457 [Agrobacterium fabrum]|uniref:hypothetical protein n=1 Tax=Agrobacterium fabrum TaxID=1176649 RepID=UPI00088A02A1|nr:hypothetical protein [Agrobacterium fabrum]MDH6296279.1 hypothetical protein [Agrobacterium fabrum]SDB72322.1 hypothetical protein SAMN03159422_04457 [Agrobacterium fabrum]SER96119.1 hypothetical protein SAMN03159504_04153 [Agrobacterium fabrum]
MPTVKSRLVLYFPGFDPLDAAAHHLRYQRAAALAGKTWDVNYAVGPRESRPAGEAFAVEASAGNWSTRSDIVVYDHNDVISQLRDASVWRQIWLGFKAGAGIVSEGGAARYLRHAWRFGLFFIFPFLLMLAGGALAAGIALSPWLFSLPLWLLVVSIPAAAVFFVKAFLPFAERFHTLHLYADWRFALAVGRDEPIAREWIEERAALVVTALEHPSDEVLVVSHSMGASLALAVIGRVLELKPDALDGRKLSFATLGGAALQCAFLSSAERLRESIGAIARHPDVTWFDIQCLTDPIHLYRCNTVALTGHKDAPQPKIVPIRFKHSLSPERYKKNKRNFLRMHRQYVLGPDRRSGYDFTLLTAGPLPAASFADLESQSPPAL